MKKLRKNLGITQQQLADYLDVTRNLLAMYETSRRSLPSTALLKLNRLQTILQDQHKQSLTTKAAAALGKISEEEKKNLEYEQIQCQHQLLVLTKKLEAIKKEYAGAIKLLYAMPTLLEEVPAGKAGEYDKKSLLLMEIDMISKVKQNNLAVQAVLYSKKEALQKQLKSLSAKLNEYQDNMVI